MGGLLSPRQRLLIEAFISQTRQGAAQLPPLMRRQADGAIAVAQALLRADGPDGRPQDIQLLADLVRAQPPEPWSWVERGHMETNSADTDDRVPKSVEERRAKRAHEFATRAVVGWIAHPGVAREVEPARSELIQLVDPLSMPDQAIITFVAASFLGGTALYPDGSEWPNPFIGAPDDVCELAETIQPRFVELLGGLATRVSGAGVPVDPTDPAVLLVLAQLALLRIDLSRPAAQLVDDLNIWPPGSIDREAAAAGQVVTSSSRHGRDVRFQADLAAFAEAVAQRTGSPPIRPRYSGGQKRATRRDTLALEKALAVLVARDPSLTPGALLALDEGEDHPGLEQLRKAVGKDEGWMPDRRRIERLWPKERH